MSKEPKPKSNLRHKLFMFWIGTQKRESGYDFRNPMPDAEVEVVIREANQVTELIWPEYQSRLDAPLWFDRMIRQFNSGNIVKYPEILRYFDKVQES